MKDLTLRELSRDDICLLVSALPAWVHQWKRGAMEEGKRVGTSDTSEYLYTVAAAAALRTIGLSARVLFHETTATLVSDEEHREEQVDACTITLGGEEFGLRGKRGRTASLKALMQAYYPDYLAGPWDTDLAGDGAEDVYAEANPEVVQRMIPTLEAWVAERHAARLDGSTTPPKAGAGKPRF